MTATKANYPLPSYNYKVSIGSQTMSFSEVSGLTISYEKVVYKDGLSHLFGSTIVRAQKSQPVVTLKRGMAVNRNELYAWLQSKLLNDIFVDLCDENGLAVIRWKLSKAMPLKIDALAFNAASSEVAIESIELIAHDLNIEYLS